MDKQRILIVIITVGIMISLMGLLGNTKSAKYASFVGWFIALIGFSYFVVLELHSWTDLFKLLFAVLFAFSLIFLLALLKMK